MQHERRCAFLPSGFVRSDGNCHNLQTHTGFFIQDDGDSANTSVSVSACHCVREPSLITCLADSPTIWSERRLDRTVEEAEGGIGRPERKRQARRLLQADLRRTAWAGLPCVHVVLPRFWQPSDLTAALREDNLAALKYGEKVPKKCIPAFCFSS